MKKTQRLKYALAAPIFVIASVVLQFANVTPTYAATLTWTGGGDGTTFSDPENWNTGVAPVNNDAIVLPAILSAGGSITLNNDLNIAYTGITLRTSNHGASNYNSTSYNADNSFRLANGATITTDRSGGGNSNAYLGRSSNLGSDPLYDGVGNVTITDVSVNGLRAAGDVTLGGFGYLSGAYDIEGDITVNTNAQITMGATGASANSVIVNGGRVDVYASSANATVNIPLDIQAANSRFGVTGHCVSSGGSGNSGPCEPVETTLTYSGPVNLAANLAVNISPKVTLSFTGEITKNGNNITQSPESAGTLIIGGSEVVTAPTTREITDSAPTTSVTVGLNETVILNGTRGYVNVTAKGALKGTGTADYVYVQGTLAPGLSPGTLTFLDGFTLGTGAVYEAEILNKDSYDKVIAGAEYTGSGNAISLGWGSNYSVLKTVLVDGWKITKGEQFTIIDNRSSTAIEGIFQGLPEGTQFTVGEAVFSISYVGGDGNDVVLTAVNSVSAPNTGVLQAVKANPAIVAVLGVVSAAAVLGLALRRKTNR